MVPGSTSANFQLCDIAVMHLSITVRPRRRLLVQLPPTTECRGHLNSRVSAITTRAERTMRARLHRAPASVDLPSVAPILCLCHLSPFSLGHVGWQCQHSRYMTIIITGGSGS